MRGFLSLVLLSMLSLACRLIVPAASTPVPVLPPAATPAQPEVPFDSAKLGTTAKDISYCTLENVTLKMDIYYPDQPSSAPWPLVVYVHGGAWQKGDKAEGAGIRDFQSLQKSGFLVASVNYRLAPENQFPAQIQDVKCAIRYFRAHAVEYHLDPEKIGVLGGSAGGHLVSLLGLADESAGWDVGEYLNQSSRVQAVVDMFGPADLTRDFAGLGAQIQKDVFGASGASDPLLAAASPVNYVSADDPPFLILQGQLDDIVPLEQSQILFERLQAVGVSSELVIVQNAGHGFRQMGNLPIQPSRVEISKKISAFFIEQLR